MSPAAITSNTTTAEESAGVIPGSAQFSLPQITPLNYDRFLDCVHCGLCTASCPTYVETGDENNSPRGRIYLMRAVTDGRLPLGPNVRKHLDLCLDCRACESACPSGVQYGQLIEPFRLQMAAEALPTSVSQNPLRALFQKWVLLGLFPFPEKVRMLLWPARWAQRLGLENLFLRSRLWKLLPNPWGRLATLLPPLEHPLPALPDFLPATGKRRSRVAFFTGCVADALFRKVHWATARVLQANGCDVVVPQGQGCCGAIPFHAGSPGPAREMANQNLNAFDLENIDAIVVNVAGCGAMLKDYGHHWNDAAQERLARFSAKVQDVQEFLAGLGMIAPTGEIRATATYHDACHLAHAQNVREQPRTLLRQIPGLNLVDLPESELCCGAAGTYNLLQPDMADRLAKRKLDNILRTKARLVITANAGCLLQIMREARLQGETLKVVHPMELLDMSYRNEPWPA